MSRWLVAAGVSGALAVAAGAFGAHALRDALSAAQRETFETAARYHLVHSLALAVVALAAHRTPGARAVDAAGWLFALGIVAFSGSLYALVLTGARWLGPVTPIGGVLLIAGWLCLAWLGWRGMPIG